MDYSKFLMWHQGHLLPERLCLLGFNGENGGYFMPPSKQRAATARQSLEENNWRQVWLRKALLENGRLAPPRNVALALPLNRKSSLKRRLHELRVLSNASDRRPIGRLN